MTERRDQADEDASAPQPAAGDPAQTDGGAPTDAAHRAVGDGTLIGAIPAGLDPGELEEIAKRDRRGTGGTS